MDQTTRTAPESPDIFEFDLPKTEHPTPDEVSRLLEENRRLRALLERRALSPEEKREQDICLILNYLDQNPQRTVLQVSEATGLAVSRVAGILTDLRKGGSVLWIGCWIVARDGVETDDAREPVPEG